jgi:predicted metal-dependent phosphoesterase TrpH
LETIERLREQDAVISIPHPFDTFRTPHFTSQQLQAIMPYVDALEVFNARCIINASNEVAEDNAASHGLLATVGSDAHSLVELGKANLLMGNFIDRDTFLTALRDAQKITRKSSPLVHFSSRFAKFYKKMKSE